MKRGILALSFLVALIVAIVPLSANAITAGTYDLTYELSGSGVSSGGPWGTISLSDSGGGISVTIDLAGTEEKILTFGLLYTGSTGGTFAITGGTTIVYDPNPAAPNITADGYPTLFTLGIPENGNLGAIDTFTGLITTSGGTISVADLTGDGNGVFAFVHIGNFGDLPGSTGENSIWVGNGPPPPRVPEPGTLLLLGSGLVGLAFLGRKLKA